MGGISGIIRIVVLLSLVLLVGCANRNRAEDSLLQANRNLEMVLYYTHNQLLELQQENELLKSSNTTNDIHDDNTIPLPIIERKTNIQNTNEPPPISTPQIIIQDNIDSTTVPESLKGTINQFPTWSPTR
ncbi:MAG: hypothetical protein LBQ66_00090 [Planctomycetaceae bacterium]|nr:hypothetical protein [Planctomycetaceae bacterium]